MSILETPRLTLRPMVVADLDFVAAMLGDAEVMRWYPRCYTREEAALWIERQQRRYERHGHGLWLAVEKSSGRPVGQVGLLIQRIDGVEEKEVAYLLHRPFWGQGFATEAAAACRDYAFATLRRRRVFALIRPENERSRAVATRLGMHAGPQSVEHGGFTHLVYAVEAAESVQTAPGPETPVSI